MSSGSILKIRERNKGYEKKKGRKQYLCIKQQLKHLTKEEYLTLRELCHAAKNLYNEGLYSVRQHFFRTGKYLPYSGNYPLLKNSENYKTLNSNMAQQILKEVDGTFRSFFGLLKLAGEGRYAHRDIFLPHYLPKDGYITLVVGFVRLNGNRFVLPYSNSFKKTHAPITIILPPVLEDKTIKEIRIIPKSNARFFEIQYIYEAEKTETILDKNKALAIDLGINNLAICVTHSPILLAIPDADIFSFDEGSIQQIRYEDTESYQITKMFLDNREYMLKRLLAEDEEE